MQYLFDNPEDGWNDGAKETIEYYDTETMDFCIDHGEIMVFFESYELKSGMAGPVSIPLGINYPVHEADDLQTFLTTGSNEYGSGWSFLDTSLDRDENPIVETSISGKMELQHISGDITQQIGLIRKKAPILGRKYSHAGSLFRFHRRNQPFAVPGQRVRGQYHYFFA